MTPDQLAERITVILAVAKDATLGMSELEWLLSTMEGKRIDTFVVRDAVWQLIDKGIADFTPLRNVHLAIKYDREAAIKAMDRFIMRFFYVNYRGINSYRRVLPLRLRFAATEWHPEPQWLMDALDVDRGEERSFAMKDMRMEDLVDDSQPRS